MLNNQLIYDITVQGSDRNALWVIIAPAVILSLIVAYPFHIYRARRNPESAYARKLATSAEGSLFGTWPLRHPLMFSGFFILFFGGGLLGVSLTYYFDVAHIRRADYALLEGRVTVNTVDRVSVGRFSSQETDYLTIRDLPFVAYCAPPVPRPKPGDRGSCVPARPGDHVRVAYISPTRPGETEFRYRPIPLLIWMAGEQNMEFVR